MQGNLAERRRSSHNVYTDHWQTWFSCAGFLPPRDQSVHRIAGRDSARPHRRTGRSAEANVSIRKAGRAKGKPGTLCNAARPAPPMGRAGSKRRLLKAPRAVRSSDTPAARVLELLIDPATPARSAPPPQDPLYYTTCSFRNSSLISDKDSKFLRSV